ncbi:MAG: tRNA (adenosine(37)-N6)-threonylcarbamoyltransferase complex ATPase subunit type 1 TsaE [Muribaculaceae bacterium]|nr:tRNA (adenosine(37)-N6)-threonylcarbamoyltransferase complex ATPase subunit type 1 TsaE [Muribaculaceae bacterium]
MKTIEIRNLQDLERAADEFVPLMDDASVIAFYGDMGAGKTTFINALCRRLGVTEDVANSPSFSIANEYRSDTTAELIYHFDMYRLNNLEEALDMGIEDYFDSGALCLIEWPERIEELLPDDALKVKLGVNDDDSRTMQIARI